jgi:hypothetical protein
VREFKASDANTIPYSLIHEERRRNRLTEHTTLHIIRRGAEEFIIQVYPHSANNLHQQMKAIGIAKPAREPRKSLHLPSP